MGQCDLCKIQVLSKHLVKIQKGAGQIRYICSDCYNQNISGPLRYLKLSGAFSLNQSKLKKEVKG